MAVIPHDAKENNVFYLKPLSRLPGYPSLPWFTKSPIGKNQLSEMLKEMCKDAGISGNFTNHSLCAYVASTLFQAGCNEKLIKQRTGQRTIDALQQYERTSHSQLLDVSNVMSGEKFTRKREIVSSTITEKFFSVVNISPTTVLSACNFTGCSLNFTGGAVDQAKRDVIEEKYVAENDFEGLDLDNIVGD